MEEKHLKPFRPRKRKKKDADADYDVYAEIKNKKARVSKQQKQAKVNSLKALLKRSNFYANSLLSLIKEEQKKRKRRAEAAQKKHKEKLKKVEKKICKDYGKKCKVLPQSYKTFLESVDNQIHLGEKPCFRVAVVVSHLVKKASVISTDHISNLISQDEVSDIIDPFLPELHKVLSWCAKKNAKATLLVGSDTACLPSSSKTDHQPAYIESVDSRETPGVLKNDVPEEVTHLMNTILDKIVQENSIKDMSPMKTARAECQQIVTKDESSVINGCKSYADETPILDRQSANEKRIGKCRRYIDLSSAEETNEINVCKSTLDYLLDAVCSEVPNSISAVQEFPNYGSSTNEMKAIRSVMDNLLNEICLQSEMEGCVELPDTTCCNSGVSRPYYKPEMVFSLDLLNKTTQQSPLLKNSVFKNSHRVSLEKSKTTASLLHCHQEETTLQNCSENDCFAIDPLQNKTCDGTPFKTSVAVDAGVEQTELSIDSRPETVEDQQSPVNDAELSHMNDSLKEETENDLADKYNMPSTTLEKELSNSPLCNSQQDKSIQESINMDMSGTEMLPLQVDCTDSHSLSQDHKVPCPICCKLVKENRINDHLDSCILGGERRESLRRKDTRPPPRKRGRKAKEKLPSQDQVVVECSETSSLIPEQVSEACSSGQNSLKEDEPAAVNAHNDICEATESKEDINSTADGITSIADDRGSNPWKKTELQPENPLEVNPASTMRCSDDDEEEAVETEGSSSESESEIIMSPIALRRSSRTSRCKKSFVENSDSENEDVDEDVDESNTERQNVELPLKSKLKKCEKVVQDIAPIVQKDIYNVGDVIKVIWGQKEAGKLYKAKILDRCPTDDSDWTYLVHYVGWNDAYDDWIFTSDIHSVVVSYSEPSKVEENVPDCDVTNEDDVLPQGLSLLDEKFYMPGSSHSTVPASMLTEKNGIKFFKNMEVNAAQPKLFTGGALRDYQITGYEWLKILLENGENGILADEMGLGKTIQCISIVCRMVEAGIRGPFLICAPMSTIQNWFQEFRRFAPKVPLLLYHGTSMERETLSLCMLQREKKLKTRPTVITTYDILMRDHAVLQMHKWSYLILDEGHRIKNLKCKLLKELRRIQSPQKLLLTGTPLQNNLSELWSLLNFLLPEVFDDLETFETWFDMGKLQKNQKLLLIIHKVLTPFLLRRMKVDVDLQLPPKRETTIYARLMSKQERFYRALVNRSIKELVSQKEYYSSTVGVASPDAIAQTNSQNQHVSVSQSENIKHGTSDDAINSRENARETVVRRFSMSNVIMQLRKCCNHPYLIEEPGEESKVGEGMISCSGKMMVLDQLLPKLKERGHKVLIFSQMTKMLDILEDYCYLRSFRCVRIDGQMCRDDRVESITSFTTDPGVFIFLLSTRAGGLGINLTAADTVIIYDSDWNPQNDAQAQDRCHRIGQERPVVVYRLVTTGTVDEQIVERATKKLALEKLIMHKTLFKGNLEQELTSQNVVNPKELLELLESTKNSG